MAQYVEQLPTSCGSRATGTGNRSTKLPRPIQQKIRTQGGSDAALLQNIATYEHYGAPQQKITRSDRKRSRILIDSARHAGNPLSASVSLVTARPLAVTPPASSPFSRSSRSPWSACSAGVGLYVVAAVVLREVYGLDGLATAFTVASTVGGLIFTAALVPALGLRLRQVLHEWILAPSLLAAFAGGALAVWLPLGGPHPTFAAGLGTAAAVAAGGFAALGAAIRLSKGLEYSLLTRMAARFR